MLPMYYLKVGTALAREVDLVAREIAAVMTSYKIVVDKSTVPVRTGEKVETTIRRWPSTRWPTCRSTVTGR